MSQKTVVFILGPTATGKSKLALRSSLLEQIPIVNGDSVQVYKGLKIGSALPSREDMKLAPHHLYAYIDKGEVATAADYVTDVQALLETHKNQRQWILCGGSGFYVQALEKGMFPVNAADEEVKEQTEFLIEQKGWEEIHRQILSKDPSLAKKIHVNDHYRITRALEIQLMSDKGHGELQGELRPSPFKDFKIVKVGLNSPKELLKERVIRRVREMLKEGFIEEVEGLIQENLEGWPPLDSAGYHEVKEHVLGRLPLEHLEERIVVSHMQLIKKQRTWFKRDKNIQWFDALAPDAAYDFVKNALQLD